MCTMPITFLHHSPFCVVPLHRGDYILMPPWSSRGAPGGDFLTVILFAECIVMLESSYVYITIFIIMVLLIVWYQSPAMFYFFNFRLSCFLSLNIFVMYIVFLEPAKCPQQNFYTHFHFCFIGTIFASSWRCGRILHTCFNVVDTLTHGPFIL